MMNFSFLSNFLKQEKSIHQGIAFIGKYWFHSILFFFAMQLFFNRNVSVQVNMHAVEMEEIGSENLANTAPSIQKNKSPKAQPVNQKSTKKVYNRPVEMSALAGLSGAKSKQKEWNVSDFANLTFVLNPTLAERKNVPYAIIDLKNDVCHKYVKRFAKVAINEMEKFGIPASVTIAQGLLESNAGDSKLSQQSNNHFGIKCKPQCLGCTCRNYKDDDVYDMFRVFETSWDSYREHSLLLNSERYKHLHKLGTKDYKGWAKGLKEAGYATDKQYAEKLIRIIEMLDLYQFDA